MDFYGVSILSRRIRTTEEARKQKQNREGQIWTAVRVLKRVVNFSRIVLLLSVAAFFCHSAQSIIYQATGFFSGRRSRSRITTFWMSNLQLNSIFNKSLISESLWKFLKVSENLLKSLKISESLWKSLKITENLWKSLKISKNLWNSLKVPANLWKSLKICENTYLKVAET